MLSYANTFTYSVSESGNEIILTFKQNYPRLDGKGNLQSITSESVAEIVLNREGAVALRSLLDSSLKSEKIVE